MGGDEFTLLAAPVTSAEKAEGLAKDLLRLFADPFEIEGGTLSVTASIGISLFPESAANPDELLQHADLAMYAIKREGGNGIRFFSAEMQSHSRNTLGFEPPPKTVQQAG
jgi:diguanylate cyclase (GGDEF)-like protein